MPKAVVLVIDGLGAKHLGPYGNTWIETPAFNQLASESLLIDGLFAPSPLREDACTCWWQGNAGANGDQLTELSKQGIHTQLLSDEPTVFDLPLTAAFAQQDKIEPPNGVSLAEEWDETHFAKFFAQVIQAIEASPNNSLLWVHSRGMWNPWDAPYEFRQHFVGEGDPDPSGSAQVPSLILESDFDPDTLHEIQCAFGGQVLLLDQCLTVLLAAIRDLGDSAPLLIVTSNSGFPLGEHLVVGHPSPQLLYHEALSVPAAIRYPLAQEAMKRRGGLFEFSQVTASLHAWLLERRVQSHWDLLNYSISHLGDSILLRTQFWSVIFKELSDDQDADIDTAQLFLKPDDQNEVNDVSDRCDAVVEAARDFVLNWKSNVKHADRKELVVPQILLDPIE